MLKALLGELRYNWVWFTLGMAIFIGAFGVSFFMMSGKTFVALSSVVPVVPITLIPSSMSIYMKQRRERLLALLPVKTNVAYLAKLVFLLILWLEIVFIFAIFHLLVLPSVPVIILVYRCAALSATTLYVVGVWTIFSEFSFSSIASWLRTMISFVIIIAIIAFLFISSFYLYDDMIEKVEKFNQPTKGWFDTMVFTPAGVIAGHLAAIALIVAGYLMFSKRTTFTGISENKFMGFK